MSRRWFVIAAAAVALVALLHGCKRTSQTTLPQPRTTATTTPTTEPSPPTTSTVPPSIAELKLLPETRGSDGFERVPTTAATDGTVAFDPPELSFTIARDYAQELAIPIENRLDRSLRVIAAVGRLRDGLLGDFVGPGGDVPLELGPRARATLALHLFAQDAARSAYWSKVALLDAASGAPLASAPLTVLLRNSKFAVKVTVGEADPGTLARKLTVRNDGDAVGDLAVELDPALRGRASIHPSVDHLRLESLGTFTFSVAPRLGTDFRKLAGHVIVRGGGGDQQTSVPVSFELPAGRHVFLATSFSTSSDAAAGGYCTNNPNTDTPIGGPPNPAPPVQDCPPVPPDCFGLDPRNIRISQAGVPRAKDSAGNVIGTVPWDYKPKTGEHVEIHPGFDVTSRGYSKDGKSYDVQKLPFKACVKGKAYWMRDSDYNAICVQLPDGNTIQYLHASDPAPSLIHTQSDDPSTWVDVNPGDVIGTTGGCGPGTITLPDGTKTTGKVYDRFDVHLHVQARDKNWKLIDPDCALDGKPNKALNTSFPAASGSSTAPSASPATMASKANGSGGSSSSTKAAVASSTGGKAAASAAAKPAPPAPAKPNDTTSPPRAQHLRDAYARYRPGIFDDNQPEAMWAFFKGQAGEPLGIEVWHSRRDAAPGQRRIFAAVWDRRENRAIIEPVAITDEGSVQWPSVLVLPDRRALVVWESAPQDLGPESKTALSWSISDANYTAWSAPAAVPGTEAADAAHANHDPVPLLDNNGNVLLVWQRGGDGPGARVIVCPSTDPVKPAFGEPVESAGLPAGASRPVPRIAPDGSLHLVFQAPPQPPEQGVDSAVYAAVSADGGKTFAPPTRLSPQGVDAGEADLLLAGKTARVVFRAGPEFASRVMYAVSADGGATWSTPANATPSDLYAEYPALYATAADASSDSAVGFEFYGDDRAAAAARPANCAHCPAERTALKRYDCSLDPKLNHGSEPRRIRTGFPSIRAAWLEVTFRLRSPREHVHAHDLAVLLNGHELLAQHDVIPEGTYLVEFDPSLLRVDERGIPANLVSLRTRHAGFGHYMSAADFRLQTRYAFSERYVIAKDRAEADAVAAAESERFNHARADVGLFAPAEATAPLPAAPATGQQITVPLRVGNLGEVSAENVRIEVYAAEPDAKGKLEGNPLQPPLVIDRLDPLEMRSVPVKFSYGGAPHYTIVARSDAADDFDPRNNLHVVSFAPPHAPPIRPSRPQPSKDDVVVAALGDGAPGAPFRWRLLDEGSGAEVAVVENGRPLTQPIPAGRYHVALKRYEFEGNELTFPAAIEHRAGEQTRIALNTAIELVTPAWAGKIFRWEAVRPEKPDEAVQWQSGQHAVMLLPPGDYQLAIRPTEFNSGRLLWPAVIHLADNQHAIARLDSGVSPPVELLALPAPYDWALLPADARGRTIPVQHARASWSPLLVPPGTYRWVVQTIEFNSAPVFFPETLHVGAAELVTPDAPAVLLPAASAWSGKPFRLRLVEPLTGRIVADIHHGGSPSPMIVPSGDYDLYCHPIEFQTVEEPLLRRLHLAAGRRLGITLDTGLRVVTAEGEKSSPPYLLRYHRQGDRDPVQTWTHARWGALPLPAGEYLVTFQPQQFNSDEITWPLPVSVKRGALATLTLDSGLRIAGPPGTKPDFDFEILDAVKPDQPRVQRGTRTWDTQWLPPGKYLLRVRAGAASPWQSLGGELSVEPGKIATIAMAEIPKRSAPATSQGAGVKH